MQGFSLHDVEERQHLGEQPVLEALRMAIPDEAIDA